MQISLIRDCVFAAGFGANWCRDEAWIGHQDDFNQILANLNAQAVSSNTRPSTCPDQAKESPPQPLLESAVESKRLLLVHCHKTIIHVALMLSYSCVQVQEIFEEQRFVSAEF